MPDSSLLMLLEEVRRKTLQVLNGVTDREARWAPPGLQNSILWHAGHSYVVTECLTTQAVGSEPQLPAGWFETFSWESRPTRVPPARWPALAEVITHLRTQHARLRSVIVELTPDHLDAPLAERHDLSVRYRILHALHDEACHTGEIWLLRKLQHVGE